MVEKGNAGRREATSARSTSGKKPFDENFSAGRPRRSRSATGAVIKGWDQTLVGVDGRQPDGDRGPAGARLRRGGQPGRRHQAHGHPLLRDRRPGHGLSLPDHGVRRARASGCSTCSSCCWSSAATSPRTGSARSSTRTRATTPSRRCSSATRRTCAASACRSRSARSTPTSTTSRATASQADQLALPEISLTADEAAVVGLATRVWQHARLAQATTEAVRKLTALGVDVDRVGPRHRRAAAHRRRAVLRRVLGGRRRTRHAGDASTTAGRGQTEPTTRHLQPWGVARYSGRWYVVGFDTDRGAERVFRLSRVEGQRPQAGAPGAYDVPDDVDLREVARRLAPAVPTERVVLLVREGAGLSLRRGGGRPRGRRDRPGRRGRLGPARDRPGGSTGSRTRSSPTAADVVVESPGRAAAARRRPAHARR